MTSVKPTHIRFSGYKIENSKTKKPTTRLFMPGYQHLPSLEVDILEPGKEKPRTEKMTHRGNYWEYTDDFAKGTDYRFHAPNSTDPILDNLEVVHHQKLGAFNRISPHSATAPQKGKVTLDIFADSVMPAEALKRLDRQRHEEDRTGFNQFEKAHLPRVGLRNHFNKLAATPNGGYQAGMSELLAKAKELGFNNFLLKPFIGGDNLSSHRYWTADAYVLNDTFKNKQEFRKFALDGLKNNITLQADGAFVNEGLNGIHIMSNLAYGFSSDNWQGWFQYEDKKPAAGRFMFPEQAHKQMVLGVLPTVEKTPGHPEVNFEAFDFRFINDPGDKATYKPERPTFIELYDPRLENKDGTPVKYPHKAADGSIKMPPTIKSSRDSVQNYKFPVNPGKLLEKRSQNKGVELKKAMMEWDNFRLAEPAEDNSAKKWDGQIDVALLDTKNPEVVNYLNGAVGYWSRMVMNTYTDKVARELTKARQALKQEANPSLAALNAVTGGTSKTVAGVEKILPKATSSVDNISAEDVQQAIAGANTPNYKDSEAGEKFAHTLLEEVPMSVLNLPVLFKADLAHSEFQKNLLPAKRNAFNAFMEKQILTPLAKAPVVGPTVFRPLRNLIYPQAFESVLGEKMDDVFRSVEKNNPKIAEKLRHQSIQSLMADKLGERIYLSLLTGKSLPEVKEIENDPKKLEDALYASMPASIMGADPYSAAQTLPKELTDRVEKLDAHSLATQLENESEGLNPEMVALAKNVLQQREFGLNWRIDAAKDVADMDAIRAAEDKDKPAVFKREMKEVKKFWDQLTGSMRAPFPKASIVAELTDFDNLSKDSKVSAEAMADLLNGTFTSAPNMSHTYSQINQMLYMAQRPDEFGKTKLEPSAYARDNIKGMTQNVPVPGQFNYQNLSSSHDYSTSSHALLINPMLFNMDLFKMEPGKNAGKSGNDNGWGLKENFDVACQELATKPGFRESLTAAGIQNPDEVLESLRKWTDRAIGAGGSHLQDELKQNGHELLAHYYDGLQMKINEHNSEKPEEKIFSGPVPKDQKGPFVDALFALMDNKIKPNGVSASHPLNTLRKLTPQQRNVLQTQLRARMEEPSEAKAMRAVIVNNVLDLSQQDKEMEAAQPAIWAGIDEAIKTYGAHYGYQPLDIALTNAFDAIPTEKLDANKKEELKLSIYNNALNSVLPKQQRMFAIQNALPGSPSVYMPDLTAQGGSEWTKNTYGQNRHLIRTDRLQNPDNKAFENHLDNVKKIFTARSKPELEALNNGFVIDVPADDTQGILPVVRDNGKDQVMVLVATGDPQALENGPNGKVGEGRTYQTIKTDDQNKPKPVNNLKLDSPSLVPGTRYEDVNTGETFQLSPERVLMKEVKNAQGQTSLTPEFTIDIQRMLKRLDNKAE